MAIYNKCSNIANYELETGLLLAVFVFTCCSVTYYAQYYAHVRDLCLKLTVLLEYINLIQIRNMVNILLISIFTRSLAKHFLLCWHYA